MAREWKKHKTPLARNKSNKQGISKEQESVVTCKNEKWL